MNPSEPTKILFICMGNICRSPAAEAVFLKKISDRGIAQRFDVDSAGTGAWHSGNRADARSREAGENRGYELNSRARQITQSDTREYEWLICMDSDNISNVLQLGANPARVRLLTDWHPDQNQREVPDPYYGGTEGFELMYDLIEAACDRLIDDIMN